MTCCSSMEYYVSGWSGPARFSDPACLIHETGTKQFGIIVHDGSGRYSIIRYCPWCGKSLAEDGQARDQMLFEEGRAFERQASVGAPIYKVSDATPPKVAPQKAGKGKHRRTPAQRRALSVKLKAIWAAKQAATITAGGEETGDAV